MFSIKKWKNYMKFPSVIAPAIRQRLLSLLIIVMPLIFLLLNITGIFIWKCPFHQWTGLECGGCGMTRGVIEAVKGHCWDAFLLHPFSIPLFFLWVLWVIIFFLPEKQREKIIDKIEIIENKTGLFFILVTLFIIFGVVRFVVQVVQIM